MDGVLQFPDVSRPLVAGQGAHRRPIHRGDPEFPLVGEAAAEVVHQQRQVPTPLPKRREAQFHDGDPVIEVQSEPLPGHFAHQVAVGGGDQPEADLSDPVFSHPPVFLFLEDAEQLGLDCRRQVADLVEEQRAAIGLLQQSPPIGPGAGESAAHVAEQLALQEVAGDSGAVQGHEGAG